MSVITTPLSRRGLISALGLGTISLGLAACGNPAAQGSAEAADSTAASSAAASGTKIVFGTEGVMPPYTYLDDNNKLTGFDVEVVRALDKKLKSYSFDFQTIEWSSMFASLDAGKIDGVVNYLALNDERKEKYLYEQTPYSWTAEAIVFKKGRTDIKSIEDLHGKTVDAGTTSSNTLWLENYNKEHGDPIKINYTDGDVSKMLQDIVNGRADATINSPVTTRLIAQEQGVDVDSVLLTDQGIIPIYLIFPKTDEGKQLAEAVDPVVQDLLADGTIKKLSEKFLGADYSTKEAVEKLAAKQQA